jgi:hypothetical protein
MKINLARELAYIQQHFQAVVRIDDFPVSHLFVQHLLHHRVHQPLPLLMVPSLLLQNRLHCCWGEY